ncbi:helix-turn-helix domain-containing protein [Nitrospira sp. M1]
MAFREAFGTTPAQYIITQRLRRVQSLLVNGKDDITSIAHATGFSSHSHLTTTFKKHLHITPSQFRQSINF